MAVNMLAKRAVRPVAAATTSHGEPRLAPPRPRPPQDSTPLDTTVQQPPRSTRRFLRSPGRADIADPNADRWLGAPRLFRLPHLALPRVSLPQMGRPHWSLKMPVLPGTELAELGAAAAQLLALWNGPNVEDIRRFEGNGQLKYSYGWFQNLLTQSARSKDEQARRQFLAEFSAHGSPKLTDELAALEYFCMKTAYLRLQPGDRHRFCCDDYGWQTVKVSIRDFETGLVAHVLVPDQKPALPAAAVPLGTVVQTDVALTPALPSGPAPGEPIAPAAEWSPGSKPPVLVMFRGTSRASSQPESEFAERPTGCRADLDWDGIGFAAFAANEARLLKIVREYMARGHRVVFAGHSLGGVFAARMMCALTPDEQQHAFLRTFNASGLDPATRRRAVVPDNNVMVRHRDDKLPRAGGELLDGTLVTTEPQNETEALYPHGMPLLAANALNGTPPKSTRKPTDPSDMSPTLEMGRKFLCLVAHDRVDI